MKKLLLVVALVVAGLVSAKDNVKSTKKHKIKSKSEKSK